MTRQAPEPDGRAEAIDTAVQERIGAALRSHRLAAGLTMRELGARSGLSQPFLSSIENGHGMPSVAALYRLAQSLGVDVHALLPTSDDDVVWTRAVDGVQLRVADQPGSATSRLLATGRNSTTQGRHFHIAPGQSVGGWFDHPGEDLVIVVAGKLLIEFADGRSFDLAAGDSLWHRSEIAHRWSVGQREGAEVILITTTRSRMQSATREPDSSASTTGASVRSTHRVGPARSSPPCPPR